MLPVEFADVLRKDPTLLERVSASQEEDFRDEYQLLTTLRLARQAFADRLEAWIDIRNKSDKSAVRAANAEMLNGALEDMLRIYERITKIDKLLSEYVSIHTVYGIFTQIKKLVDRELRDVVSPDILARLKGVLDEEVTVPGNEASVNDVLSPADAVRYMDQTIPGGDVL